MTSEWASYAPDAREIVRAFVDGVNAWIAHIRTHPPIEFTLLGSAPEPWSYEVPLQRMARSEEHTSELQSRLHLVCRLLLEKKKHKRTGRTAPAKPPRRATA